MKKTYSTKKALIVSALSLFLCIAMLAGSTFAWFTDTVKSENNIIQTGNLDVEMFWADGDEDPAKANWIDASKGAMFNHGNWEPGYTQARHIKIANEGSLALNYRLRIVANGAVSKLADVIDVYYVKDTTQAIGRDLKGCTKIGTLTQVLGTAFNLSNTVNGSLTAGETKTWSLVLKMQETADNDYQSMDLGCTFSVELTATQMVSESDSFGNNYDENALSAMVPAARVMSIDADETVSFVRDNETVTVVGPNLAITATAGIGGEATAINLNTVYKFEPTQTDDDMMASEYKYYVADFIISADKDVPANSMALAGYYDAWCQWNNDNWVALASDAPISAGTEIRLVKSMIGSGVHYKDICQYGNDGLGFMCGAVDLTGENIGTTLTVKLCLFETTADPNGSSANTEETGSDPIVIGEFKYTFTTKNVATANDLATAIANGVENITLTKDVTLDNAALDVAAGSDIVLDLGGKTITVNNSEAKASAAINNKGNLTIKNGTVTYQGVGDPSFGYGTNTIHNTGKLVIDGATVINTTASGSSVAIDCAAGAELIVNGGEIISEKNAIRLCPFSAAPINCTINGGTITGARAIQIQLPSNKPDDAPVINLTVNGGELTGTSGLALYSYSAGQSFDNTNVTITGGTFNGDVCFGGGAAKATQETVTVTGGTFSGYLGRYLANNGWEDIVKP